MVEADRADRREGAQIVFIGRVIAVPGDDVDRRMRQGGLEQRPAPFHEQLGRRVLVLVVRDRRQEVARIGEAVGADRPALRQREGAAVVLAEITARRPVRNLDAEFYAARDHHDLAGLGVDAAELGDEAQVPLLEHEHQLAVGIVEMLVHHRLGDEIDMRGHAGLRIDVAGRRHGLHALNEGHLLLRHRRRVPAHLGDGQIVFMARRRAPQARIGLLEAPRMLHRGTDAVEPGALIGAARRGEGRTRELLGIEPVGAALRRVAPDRQRARQGFRLKAVPEAGHVARRDLGRASDDLIGRGIDVHDYPPPCKAAHIS
ncbi:hypothetical protein AB7M42_000349 [Bradyrhizobium diazoefficiens]